MTAGKSDIDRGFYERARRELERIGVSAREFIRKHPNKSKKELAELIGGGVTSRGLTMKLFEEARACADIGSLARDLLYRTIATEFPDGWYRDDEIHASVKLASWHYDVHEFAPEHEESATQIVQLLTTTKVPELGWKPESADDERLRRMFEENWIKPG